MRLHTSLRIHVARSTAMIISELDDVRRNLGGSWTPTATYDTGWFLVAGLLVPIMLNLFQEVSQSCSQTELKRAATVLGLHNLHGHQWLRPV